MSLAGYARSGKSPGVSKAQTARGQVEKCCGECAAKAEEKPFAGAATPFGSEEATSTEESTPQESKGLASYARAGQQVEKQISPMPQPRVPSNIPGAGTQGVPPAEADEMGAFARRGNVEMQPRIVAAQTGLASHGPAVMSSLARMGGQVKLAPGQFGAWAHPQDPVDVYGKPSAQVTSDPNRPGSLPPPASPVY